MSKFSLDKDNKRAYGARAEQWKGKAEELEKTVENSCESGIIELYRKKKERKSYQTKSTLVTGVFDELTIEARLSGCKKL